MNLSLLVPGNLGISSFSASARFGGFPGCRYSSRAARRSSSSETGRWIGRSGWVGEGEPVWDEYSHGWSDNGQSF